MSNKDDPEYGLETIIKKILIEKPGLTREKLLDLIEKKRVEAKGLLNREGAAFLVAADLGVSMFGKEKIVTRMKVGDVLPNLGDVSVVGRVLMVYDLQEFVKTDGSKGKLRRILIGDESGMIEVFVWNEKVEDLDRQNIKPDSLVKVEHAYSRSSVDGKVELHVGERGSITLLASEEVEPVSYTHLTLPTN